MGQLQEQRRMPLQWLQRPQLGFSSGLERRPVRQHSEQGRERGQELRHAQAFGPLQPLQAPQVLPPEALWRQQQ